MGPRFQVEVFGEESRLSDLLIVERLLTAFSSVRGRRGLPGSGPRTHPNGRLVERHARVDLHPSPDRGSIYELFLPPRELWRSCRALRRFGFSLF